MHVDAFDPIADDTIQSPYLYYRALREQAPVHKPAGFDYYCVSRFADIEQVVLDPDTYSSNIVSILMASGEGTQVLDLPSVDMGPVDVLAIQDPPRHGPQRRVVTRVLSRAHVRALEGEVRRLASDVLASSRGTTVDFMAEVAFPLPMAMVIDLLGLPQADLGRIKDWCDHAVALLGGVNTPEDLQAHMMAGLAFHTYLVDQCARAPATPLMQALADAVATGELTEREWQSIAMQLLIAGSDSSASALGSAVAMLARDPELQATLRAQPEQIGAFMEEVLRLETPFQGHFRVTTRDTELGGVDLPAGTRLMVLWATANRDERAWTRPDEVVLDRKRGGRHLAFGHGLHRCLGAALARLEGRVVLEELLARSDHFELATPAPRYRKSVFVRTLETLPLRVQWRMQMSSPGDDTSSARAETTREPASRP